jgi:hypothetical protein
LVKKISKCDEKHQFLKDQSYKVDQKNLKIDQKILLLQFNHGRKGNAQAAP